MYKIENLSCKNDPQRILSLDGGGVHALAFLPIIEHIEDYLGCGVAESGQFQMFVGTSTGSIVAAGLKLGMRASTLVALYKELARRVFLQSPPWETYFAKYSSDRLKHALEETFLDIYGRDPTWEELALNSTNRVTLMVVLWDISAGRTTFLSTNLDNNKTEDQLLHGAPLSAVITACCSAPTYFAPQAFFASDDRNRVYCDGGITGLNNPAAAAAAVLWEGIRDQGTPLHVISLGTGKAEVEYPVSKIRSWGFVEAAKNSVDALFGSTETLMDRFFWVFGPRIGVERYFRAEPRRGVNEALDYTENLDYLYGKLEKGSIKYRVFPTESTSSDQTLDRSKILEICHLFGLRASSCSTRDPSEASRRDRSRLPPPVAAVELRGNLWIRPDLLGVLGGIAIFFLLFGLGWLSYHREKVEVNKLTIEEKDLKRDISKLSIERDRIRGEAWEAAKLAGEQARIAKAQHLSAQGVEESSIFPQRGLLLASEAFHALQPDDPYVPELEQNLRSLLGQIGGFVFCRSQGPIYAVAFSPNNRLVATAETGGLIRIWNSGRPGEEPLILKAPFDTLVLSMAFSPDGTRLLTGNYDGKGRVWRLDVPKNDPILLSGSQGSVSSVTYSPNGRYLALASDKEIRIWRTDSLTTEPAFVIAENTPISSIAFSSDSNMIGCSGEGFGVHLWPFDRTKPEPILLKGPLGVNGVAFSRDGSIVAGAMNSPGTILIWLLSHTELQPLKITSRTPYLDVVALSADDKYLLAAGSDGIARLWIRANLAAAHQSYRGHEGEIKSAAISLNGRFLATGGDDGTARLWRIGQPGADPTILYGHNFSINAAKFSADGKLLATGSDDGTVKIWNLTRPFDQPITLDVPVSTVFCVDFSNDGKRLVAGSYDGPARVWNVERPTDPPSDLTAERKGLSAAAFSPDGQWLATSDGGDLLLRIAKDPNLAVDKRLGLIGPSEEIWSMAFSADSKHIITTHNNRFARVWPITHPDDDVIILSHENMDLASSAAFHPGGGVVAVGGRGGGSGVVMLWNLSRVAAGPTILRGHSKSVNSVAFNVDGRRLLSTADDGSARLWWVDQPSSNPIVLHADENSVNTGMFSPDGKRFVTGGDDGEVRLWTAKIGDLVQQAGAIAGRNLTEEEWSRFLPSEPFRPTFPGVADPHGILLLNEDTW